MVDNRYFHLETAARLIWIVTVTLCLVSGYFSFRLFRNFIRGSGHLFVVVIAALGIVAWSAIQAASEQAILKNNFNLGKALLLAVLAFTLLMVGGLLARPKKLLAAMLLATSSAIFLGDLIGWVWRLAQPSKFSGL